MNRDKDIIGLNIKNLMEAYGYSQQELALEADISQSSLSQYINGERMPNAKVIYKITKVLDCTLDELFDESILDQEEP